MLIQKMISPNWETKLKFPLDIKDETAFLKSLASTAKKPGKTSQKGTATVLAIYSSDWEY